MDLRLQGPELGVAGQDPQLQGVLLGPACGFLGEERVVEGSGQEVEEGARGQDHRDVVRRSERAVAATGKYGESRRASTLPR